MCKNLQNSATSCAVNLQMYIWRSYDVQDIVLEKNKSEKLRKIYNNICHVAK